MYPKTWLEAQLDATRKELVDALERAKEANARAMRAEAAYIRNVQAKAEQFAKLRAELGKVHEQHFELVRQLDDAKKQSASATKLYGDLIGKTARDHEELEAARDAAKYLALGHLSVADAIRELNAIALRAMDRADKAEAAARASGVEAAVLDGGVEGRPGWVHRPDLGNQAMIYRLYVHVATMEGLKPAVSAKVWRDGDGDWAFEVWPEDRASRVAGFRLTKGQAMDDAEQQCLAFIRAGGRTDVASGAVG